MRLALRRGNTLLIVGSAEQLLTYAKTYPDVWKDWSTTVEVW